MVKPPKIRHSKLGRSPLTIDLDAEEVARPADSAQSQETAEATPGRPADIEAAATADPARESWTESAGESPAAEPHAFGRPVEPEEAPPPPPGENIPAAEPVPPPRGRAPIFVAGLFGALIALVGAGILQWSGLLPAPAGTGAAGADVAALQADVAALKQQAAAAGQVGQKVDGLDSALAGLKAELDSLKSAVGAAPGSPADPAATQKIAALERGLSEIRQAFQATTGAQAGKIAALEKGVADLSARVGDQASQPDVARAIAAQALKSAVDRGTAFSAELDAYAAIAPASPDIEALRALAASGVPSRAAVEAEADAAATAMVDAARPVDPDAGILARLFASAGSLVKVRPVGTAQGMDAASIAARLNAALGEGNYAAALKEYESLPAPAKEAGAAFMAKVKARHTAEQLAAKVLAAALKPA